MVNKNILFITPFPISVPLDGGKKCILNRIQYFSQKCVVDVLMLGAKHSETAVEEYRSLFCKARHIMVLPEQAGALNKMGTWRKIKTAFNWVITNIPRSVQRLVYNEKKGKIMEYILREKIDVVVFEFPQTMEVVDLKILKKENIKTIVVAHGVESLFFKELRNDLPDFLVKIEFERIERYECKSLKQVDKVIGIAPEDVEYLKKRHQLDNILYLPPYFSTQKDKWLNIKSTDYIIFCGALSFYPNYQGILWFLDNIFNKYTSIYINVKLKLTGKITETMKAELSKYNNLIFTGYLSEQDLENEIINSAFMVVPIVKGSGVKIKLLEALSYGVPTITTLHGAAGVPFKGERPYLTGANEKEILDYMILLTENNNEKEKLSERARAFFESTYASSKNTEAWERELVN